jgi:MFS family permease
MGSRSEASATDQASYPHRWRALAVTQLAGFMSLLDVSIVNVALPSIQRSLGASVAQVQWVVSGYALSFGLVLVAGGRLGDALGRRRMFLIALSGFVLTSALCGAAPSAGLLVAARLLQGLAAGMLTPQSEAGRSASSVPPSGCPRRSDRCSVASSLPRRVSREAGGGCSTSTCPSV